MNNTMELFEDRKSEIEFYYSILLDIDSDCDNVRTMDNSRFLRILKSNFLLMLYNLIEACVVSGMTEIYSILEQSESAYEELVDQIQRLWTNNSIDQIYISSGDRKAYENKVQEIISIVIGRRPIILTKDMLKRSISGNLDAKKIKEICDKHKIRYVASDDDNCLRTVKIKRQNLAHGDESFGDCARDMTLTDLEHIKDVVVSFMRAILSGMKVYYDEKQYLKCSS